MILVNQGIGASVPENCRGGRHGVWECDSMDDIISRFYLLIFLRCHLMKNLWPTKEKYWRVNLNIKQFVVHKNWMKKKKEIEVGEQVFWIFLWLKIKDNTD